MAFEIRKNGKYTLVKVNTDRLDTNNAPDLKSELALVVGSEGSGLRPVVRKRCDLFLSIPMQGGVPSLNASVAVAVSLFETVRQRSA